MPFARSVWQQKTCILAMSARWRNRQNITQTACGTTGSSRELCARSVRQQKSGMLAFCASFCFRLNITQIACGTTEGSGQLCARSVRQKKTCILASCARCRDQQNITQTACGTTGRAASCLQELSGSASSSSPPVCRLWVAATTTGIQSEHVAQQDAAASNMYAMCCRVGVRGRLWQQAAV